MSRILVLAGSVRKGGNTDILVKEFVRGAEEHNEVDVVSVADRSVNPCIGCDSCFRNEGECFQKDGMQEIYDKLKWADIAVVASPVYFYGLSAQLKAVIDRLHNPIRNELGIKKLAMILVGGAVLDDLFDPIILQYNMVRRFFDLEDAGMVLVRGVRAKGDVLNSDGPKKAYELGLSMK